MYEMFSLGIAQSYTETYIKTINFPRLAADPPGKSGIYSETVSEKKKNLSVKGRL